MCVCFFFIVFNVSMCSRLRCALAKVREALPDLLPLSPLGINTAARRFRHRRSCVIIDFVSHHLQLAASKYSTSEVSSRIDQCIWIPMLVVYVCEIMLIEYTNRTRIIRILKNKNPHRDMQVNFAYLCRSKELDREASSQTV